MPEIILPESIDHHSGNQRILAADQPASEFETITNRKAFRNLEKLGRTREHLFAMIKKVSTNVDKSLA